jgi:hypothetical protein
MSVEIKKDITTVTVEVPKTGVAVENAVTNINVQVSQPQLTISQAGVSGRDGTSGTSGTFGNVLSSSLRISGSIIPNVADGDLTSSFSLGSATNAWKDLWISKGTIYFIGDNNQTASISINADNQIQISDINLTGSLTASLKEGYIWVGGPGNVTILVATASLITGGSGTSGVDGSSGTSGITITGSAGTSGVDGSSGTSGTSGLTITGSSGSHGTSGTSGISVLLDSGSLLTTSSFNEYSSSIDLRIIALEYSSSINISGSNGSSGVNGTSGTSGLTITGSAGSDGTSGTSGISPASIDGLISSSQQITDFGFISSSTTNVSELVSGSLVGDSVNSTIQGNAVQINYGITKGDFTNRFTGLKVYNYDWANGNLAGQVEVWTDSDAQDFSTRRFYVDGFGKSTFESELSVTGSIYLDGTNGEPRVYFGDDAASIGLGMGALSVVGNNGNVSIYANDTNNNRNSILSFSTDTGAAPIYFNSTLGANPAFSFTPSGSFYISTLVAGTTASLYINDVPYDSHLVNTASVAQYLPVGVISSSQQITDLGFGAGGGDVTSLNNFTGSIRAEIDGIEAYTASLKATTLISGAAQITALGFGAGGGDVTALNTYTGSNDSVLQRIMQTTASLNIVTGSFARIWQTTASLNTFTGSIRGEVNGLEAYTASLKAATLISSSTQIVNFATFATLNANNFNGTQIITGSLIVSSTAISEATLFASASNLVLNSGSNLQINNSGLATINNRLQVSGSTILSGSTNLTGSVTINESRIDNGWTAYTPQWTAASSNPAIGDGTIEGYYKVIGKTCFVRGNIVIGTTTTLGSGEWYVSMPFTASHADAILMSATLLDNGTAWYNATVAGARAGFNHKAPIQYQTTGGTAGDVNATAPFTWISSDRFIWNGSYEIA